MDRKPVLWPWAWASSVHTVLLFPSLKVSHSTERTFAILAFIFAPWSLNAFGNER